MEGEDEVHFSGLAIVVPENGGSKQYPDQAAKSNTWMSRAAYDDKEYKCSSRFTETHKAGDFVNKSGSVGYKQESRYTSTVKYHDKVEGSRTEYQTQVNVRKVVYPPLAQAQAQAPQKSSSKRINYY